MRTEGKEGGAKEKKKKKGNETIWRGKRQRVSLLWILKLVNHFYNGACRKRARRRRVLICRESASKQTARLAVKSKESSLHEIQSDEGLMSIYLYGRAREVEEG